MTSSSTVFHNDLHYSNMRWINFWEYKIIIYIKANTVDYKLLMSLYRKKSSELTDTSSDTWTAGKVHISTKSEPLNAYMI